MNYTEQVRCGGHGFAHRPVEVKPKRNALGGCVPRIVISYEAQCPDCDPDGGYVGVGTTAGRAVEDYARLWGKRADDITLRSWS